MRLSRLRGSAGTLLALMAVVAVLSAFSVGALVFLEQQATAGIRSALATRAGADLALRASLAPSANPQLQDDQVRAAIAHSFAPSGVDFEVTRTLSADIMIAVGESVVESATAMSIPDLDTRVAVVDGAFSDRATDVVVQADAAQALGLVPGSTVTIDGAKFSVAATWRATDYLDPRWYGDPLVAEGVTDEYGPFVIAESAWSRLQSPPKVTWTVVPRDLGQLTSTNPPDVIGAWSRIQADWRGQVTDLQAFGVQRGFSESLAELNARVEGQRAIEPVIFTLLGVLALVSLSEVVGLLISLRSRESLLYWARGLSPLRIARRAALDGGVSSAIGAAIGLGGALAVVALSGGGGELVALIPRLLVAPVAVVLAATLIAGIRSYRAVVSETRQSRGGRGAARKAATPVVVVLAVVAAGISVWQLRLYGSPITASADSPGEVDPVAVAAPAIALVALVLVIAALLPAAARRLERLLHRRSTTTRLAARTLVQYTARFTAALVVVALAIGTSVIAAAYSATWTSSYDAASQLRVGADLQVASGAAGISAKAQSAVAAAAGQGSVAPVEVQSLSLGSVSGSILAIAPDALAELGTDATGLLDPEAAASAIRINSAGPTIPVGATDLAVTLAYTGLVGPPSLSAYLADSFGNLTAVRFDPSVAVAPVDGTSTLSYRADLPGSVGDRTLLSVDLAFAQQTFGSRAATVRLVALSAAVGGTDVPVDLDQYWIPGNPGERGVAPTGDGTGLGMVIVDNTPTARFVPSFDGGQYDRATPPVIISQLLANQLGLGPGDPVSFTLQDGVERQSFVIAQVVPAIPGAPDESALLMDLAVIQHFQLRATAVPAEPRDLWVGTDAPSDLTGQIRPLVPANARIEFLDDPASRRVLESPRIVLWAAAITAALVALIAVGASLRSRARWGRNDVAILRALGLSARDQRKIPVAEFAVVVVLGVIWGAVAGAVTSALTVPQVVRAAVPQRYLAIGTSLSLDAAGLVALSAALLLGLAVLVIVMGRSIRSIASRSLPGEQGA